MLANLRQSNFTPASAQELAGGYTIHELGPKPDTPPHNEAHLSTLQTEPPERLEKPGIYILKRYVADLPDEVFAENEIDIAIEPHKNEIYVPERRGLTTLGARDAYKIRRKFQHESDEELLERYRTFVKTQPNTRYCFLAGVDVFGPEDPDNTHTFSHVVIVLKNRSEKALRKENVAALGHFGLRASQQDATLHIRLFKTRNNRLAYKIASEVEGIVKKRPHLTLNATTPKRLSLAS